ncbi:hypothetical protein TNCV_4755481 [Trichonephila clavipes]|nr:hypothetical protein TNCV_4755481 [Trichonephila clavipes]
MFEETESLTIHPDRGRKPGEIITGVTTVIVDGSQGTIVGAHNTDSVEYSLSHVVYGKRKCAKNVQFLTVAVIPRRAGRDEVPPSTSVLTQQNASGAKGGSAGRKTGWPNAVDQVGDNSPQELKRKRCCAMKLLVLFRVWKENSCRVMGAKWVSPLR